MSNRQAAAQVSAELEDLRRQDGSLSPADVRDWAKEHPKSALHGLFTWNADQAAHEYQLWQARQIIKRYAIRVESSGETGIVVPVVSVPSLRRNDEGSYLSQTAVSANEDYRLEVLAETKKKLRTMADKHRTLLPELQPVWRMIDKHC